jgi:hypothetical protein
MENAKLQTCDFEDGGFNKLCITIGGNQPEQHAVHFYSKTNLGPRGPAWRP